MTSRARRSVLVATFVLAGGVLLGGTLDRGPRAEGPRAEPAYRAFGQILSLVEGQYAGKVDPPELVEDAIQGMLRTLDPHSNYLDRASYSEMKDEQRGKFYGLGIQINKNGPDKPLTIIAPIDGTPAARAGLQAGDLIVRIEGEDAMPMTVHQAVGKLKGEKGTQVTISIQRPGEDAPFDVTLTRDEIPTHSIPVAYLLRPGTGFVRISNFTGTTASELDEHLRELRGQGMERLILDLRSNPGGLLDQAVQVSEKFLPPGKMVVYTRGRVPGSDQDFLAGGSGERTEIPLVVLVDRHSASASEIVSGAIQDHDRGVIVGETTFGKGLVQRVIPLRDGGALALTTAKYYTPSGRLIQRDYSDLEDYLIHPELEDGEDPTGNEPPALPDGGTPPSAPTGVKPSDREVRYTDSGRVVYGGGGISPDYVVPNGKVSLTIGKMRRENLIFDFAVRWLASHPDVKEGFAIDDRFFEDFRAFLKQRKFEISDQELAADREALSVQLRARIARVKWGETAENRVLAEADPQVQKALTVFGEAAALRDAGHRSREEKDRRAALRGDGA